MSHNYAKDTDNVLVWYQWIAMTFFWVYYCDDSRYVHIAYHALSVHNVLDKLVHGKNPRLV